MVRPRALALFACLAFVGCLSGQTGSPDCAGPTSCLCDALSPWALNVLLRVRADSAGPDQLRATVVSVVTPGEHLRGFVAAGHVGGYVFDRCGGTSTWIAGQELLALYRPVGDDFPPLC